MDVVERLAALAAKPERAAILLDVDGTLAPIVARPQDARVPEHTRSVLVSLVGRYRLVGCISGRPSADAEAVVGVDGIRYVGEHGLELEPEAEHWARRLEAFRCSAGWPAEPGKRLTLSFHYRNAIDPAEAERVLRAVAADAEAQGLRIRWGRRVLEIRPPVDADKGTAVAHLLRDAGAAAALYAGDDTTDIDAFTGLDGLDVAVRVAVESAESPPALLEAADVVVAGPAGVVELLERL
jgi:trehalose 6-phosphate phosphatase